MDLYYRKLFNLRFTHGFYREGKRVTDFRVTMTDETRAKLGSGGFFFKEQPEGFTMLYRATMQTGLVKPSFPASDLADGELFTFRIDLLNSLFFNFTDLDAVIAGNSLRNRVLFFTAEGGTETPAAGYVEKVSLVAPQLLRAFGKQFTYDFAQAGDPATVDLKVKDRNGNVVATASTPKKSDTAYSSYLDLSARPEGLYTIERWVSGAFTGDFETVYVMGGPGPGIPFGILEIPKHLLWEDLQTHNETPANNDVIQYTIAFSERLVVWRFRVVFAMHAYTSNPADYSLEDTLLTFLPDDRYNTTNPADQFFFGLESVTTYDGKDALLYRSTESDLTTVKSYPLLEEAKHDLVLKELGIKLRDSLPNPDISTLIPEVILFV